MARDWPPVADEHSWTIEAMEQELAGTTLTPEQLTARSAELRKEAEDSQVPGYRDAALALAERYDETAARLASA